MKDNALSRFLKNLLRLARPTGSPLPCPAEEELALLAAGEMRPGAARERLEDHVARCPVCLEAVLTLRRLTGQDGPLLARGSALAWLRQPAWRPLAAAAAVLVLAGLLYLGGVSLQQVSQIPQFQESGRLTPTDLPPEASVAPPAAGGIEKVGPAAPSEPKAAPPPGRPAPASAAPRAKGEAAVKDSPGEGFAPEPVVPLGEARLETEERQDSDKSKQAGQPADQVANAPAAPPEVTPVIRQATAPSGGGAKTEDELAAAPASRLAARPEPAPPAPDQGRNRAHETTADQDKLARRESSPSALLASLRAEAEGMPVIVWGGRTFRQVRGYLVEEVLCRPGPCPPARVAASQEQREVRGTPGFDPAWRGVWLLQNGEAVLIP